MSSEVSSTTRAVQAMEHLRSTGVHVGHGFALGLVRSRGRRHARVRVAGLAVTAAIAIFVSGVFLAKESTEVTTDSSLELANRFLALREAVDLAPDDVRLLKSSLMSESTLVQRNALSTLKKHRIYISPPLLEAILDQPASRETLEHPTSVAGPSGVDEAKRRWRLTTIRQTLSTMWQQAENHGAHSVPSRIEPYLEHYDTAVRTFAVRALAANQAYTLPEKLRRRVESDNAKVRGAARELLKRR